MADAKTKRYVRGSGYAARRANSSALAGALALSVARVLGGSWAAAALTGWDTCAVLFLLWVWLTVAGRDPEQTKRSAQSEDDRVAGEAAIVAAGAASLVAVTLTLGGAGHAHGGMRAGLVVFALLSMIVAWACVQTVYVLRYARLYYGGDAAINFHESAGPDYVDFAYLALTIGMTYQVSDSDLAAKRIRRTAIGQRCCPTSLARSFSRSS